MELTPEIQMLLENVKRDAPYSSSELQKFYALQPDWKDFLKNKISENVSLEQYFDNLKKQYPNMSEQLFFNQVLLQQSKNIIEKIKEVYKDRLSPDVIEHLNKFNVEVVHDVEHEHDITAKPEENKVIINMPYFGNKGETLSSQIVRAMGTMPHEIFHFIIKMIKPKELADEKMVYTLVNGEEVYNFGMVGHIFNEGFVEKISSEFCQQNGIYYSLNPSYISFVKVCDYIMQNNPAITTEYLMSHNYEDIFKTFSPELLTAYTETERIEYAQNFDLRKDNDTKIKVDINDIVASRNEKVELEKEKETEGLETQTEIHDETLSSDSIEPKKPEFKTVKEKKQEREQAQSNFGKMSLEKQNIYKQQKETTKSNNETKTVNKPKTLTLNKPSNPNNGNASNSSSSNSGGFVNMAFMISIIILTSIAVVLFAYYLISG